MTNDGITMSAETIIATGTPKNVQLSARNVSRKNRTTPYQTKKTSSRSPVRSRLRRWKPIQMSVTAPSAPEIDSYRKSGWKNWPSVSVGAEPGGQAYAATRWAQSIGMPHGSVVGGPYSSWLKKLPQRAMASIVNRPGATMSAQRRKSCRLYRTYTNAATVPNAIPPYTPNPE